MEENHLDKGREHAKNGMAFLKSKDFEKALKQFEFSMKYFLKVLGGKK